MIQVTIDGKKYEYPENCSYYEIAKDFEKTMDAPIVLVKVDGRLRELHKQLKKDCELEFVTTKDEIGHKTYQRSLSLLLVKAVYVTIRTVCPSLLICENSVNRLSVA